MNSRPLIIREADRFWMPGLATAHSHAFQRALRGRTQRRAAEAGSFWSWRGLMYALVEKLDPEAVFNISRFAFAELTMSGVTAVGEFHYLHHDKTGSAYSDRLTMAETVIRAARAVGLRITLIRTAYMRGGHDQPLAPAQGRFADDDVDMILRDVDDLLSRYADDPMVTVAIAAHSIRAVPAPSLRALANYAQDHKLPFHMHVAEQRREIDECLQEHGRRPVELLADLGILDDRFVAVHATHLTATEIRLLGAANAIVCLCRTTERDLGDGLPQTADLLASGARICVGVDSHATSDAFEEIRAVELDERSRLEARHVAATGLQLLTIGGSNGYAANGMGNLWRVDRVTLDARDASLAGASEEALADSVIFGATPRAVDQVEIAGTCVVDGGRHIHYDDAYAGFEATMHRLMGPD